MNEYKIKYYGITDKGSRKEFNQDSIFADVFYLNKLSLGIFSVADGLGGYSEGEVASKEAIDEIIYKWNEIKEICIDNNGIDISVISMLLDETFKSINLSILSYSKNKEIKLGTTLSVLFVYNNHYLIKHIGDSRVYKYNKYIDQLTKDHSWVSQQVELGNINKEEAMKHPKRNVLLKCLGMKDEVSIFSAGGKVDINDKFLICSDGFYKRIENYEIENYLKSSSEEKDIVLFSIINEIKQRGENDNISCVFVELFKRKGKENNTLSNLKRIFGCNK